MENNQILLLDEELERYNEISSFLQNKNISVSSLDDPTKIKKYIESEDLKLILVSQQYLLNISEDDIKSLFKQSESIKIIVYDVPDDGARKLAFYKLGAYRVLDSTSEIQHISEYISNVLNYSNNKNEIEETRFSGSLLDFSIADLINSFGRDRVSGILRVHTPYCSGKIIFNEGDIDDAICGYHRGDDAALFMLTWNNGFFAMRKCPINTPKHKVQLSAIGLLLQGERIRKQYYDIIRKIGHPGVSIKIVNQGDLIPQLKNPYYKEVAEKLRHYSVLQEILAFSQINLLELVNWLYDLKKTNHLDVRDDSGIDVDSLPETELYEKSGMVERLFGAKEVEYLRNVLDAKDISTGKILVLGTNANTKTDFIHIFNQGNHTAVRTNKELDYTRINLDDYFSLNVFGISLDLKLKDTIEKISEGLLGYIVLVDAQKPDEFEYAHYIINYLHDSYSVPWTVSATNLPDKDQLTKELEEAIKLPDNREIIPCDVTQKDDIKNVILSLKRNK